MKKIIKILSSKDNNLITKVSHLDLSLNNLGDEGMLYLSLWLSTQNNSNSDNYSTIIVLKLSQVGTSQIGFKYLFEAL